MSTAVIETQGLRKTFGKGNKVVEAVRGVDLTVEEGSIFGFLGPNGAGKSTTLKMLATLLPPSGGTATVAGADLLREPQKVRQRIGFVQQGNGTDISITGRSEIVFQGQLYGLSRKQAAARAEELIASLELEVCADRATGSWSGGQRRRLDFALGIVHRPAVLFLDEPTTGLDPQGRANLWDVVRELRKTTTIFLTTHYLDEADVLCDRLAIIDHGSIVAQGTSAELKREIAGDLIELTVRGSIEAAESTVARESFVRQILVEQDKLRVYVDEGETAMPSILRLLDGVGLHPATITLARPSLDDVFLQKTGRSLRDAA